ncbi:trypsin-like serine peptidase [Streptomyces erythrochromogenes]|uniref:trypsin-like serine peptidase n=1 Tax=Streptomyces erythrochromogenes TaxID=285574 RepID=UPI00381DC818
MDKATFGSLPLKEAQGKAVIGELVSIIQHPNGEPKQLALRDDQIVDVLDDFVHYSADTARGSSGAPVFNDQWEVVALHHAAVGVPARLLGARGRPRTHGGRAGGVPRAGTWILPGLRRRPARPGARHARVGRTGVAGVPGRSRRPGRTGAGPAAAGQRGFRIAPRIAPGRPPHGPLHRHGSGRHPAAPGALGR